MKQEDDLNIDPEGEQLIKIICNYLADALKEASEECEEIEYFYGEPDLAKIARKHINKKFNYLKTEGWISDYSSDELE